MGLKRCENPARTLPRPCCDTTRALVDKDRSFRLGARARPSMRMGRHACCEAFPCAANAENVSYGLVLTTLVRLPAAS